MSFSMRLADLAENVDRLDEPARLRALLEECWANEMEDFPERATSTGWPGQGHRWTDVSEGAYARRRAETAEVMSAVATFDRDALDEGDLLSLDLFKREYEVRAEGQRFPAEYMPISKMAGPQAGVPRTFSLMPRNTIGGLEDAVARLHGLPVYVDGVITCMVEGLSQGLTPCRLTIEDVPQQLDALMTAQAEDCILLAAFKDPPDTVAPDDFDELKSEASAAYSEAALPALRRLQSYLSDEYLPKCRESVAWTALPQGDEWYEHLVRAFTTTSLAPKEIHDIGLEECRRIRSEMDVAMSDAGHTGTFEEFIEFLRTDTRFFYVDGEALLAGYRDIAKRIDPGLPSLFGVLPRLPYGVCAVPDHEAPSTTTAYYVRGSAATGRPGWFFANTYDLASRPIWEMEALTLHEAVPGHHLQIALAAELEGLPAFRTMSYGPTAFVEGWGLYAESLGRELGLFTDPYSRFGQLSYEMWRAVRLVVDTGIHAFGWTREQAIDFFRQHSSKPIHDITVEIDRYISWPGQALAYKVGERTFSRLRAEATEALGDRFDVRKFHDVVLGGGALPLDILERRVTDWLATLS